MRSFVEDISWSLFFNSSPPMKSRYLYPAYQSTKRMTNNEVQYKKPRRCCKDAAEKLKRIWRDDKVHCSPQELLIMSQCNTSGFPAYTSYQPFSLYCNAFEGSLSLPQVISTQLVCGFFIRAQCWVIQSYYSYWIVISQLEFEYLQTWAFITKLGRAQKGLKARLCKIEDSSLSFFSFFLFFLPITQFIWVENGSLVLTRIYSFGITSGTSYCTCTTGNFNSTKAPFKEGRAWSSSHTSSS